ncbi:hypothetical protein [Agriterribacter sp.]|uniref:hypothetical protein n=1 Tax=Agriterribacter sp. TaxID=2821509 RepID=UPI002BE793C9|nr:hypothetical protein [Agriterribacter sp.]HTN08463.1 hypothetical protein [Agriterribacter sp.]
MTTQYQTKVQRITMLLTLLALVIVIAKNVSAGTQCVPVQQPHPCESNAKTSVMETTTSDIKDIPWQPVISMIW